MHFRQVILTTESWQVRGGTDRNVGVSHSMERS